MNNKLIQIGGKSYKKCDVVMLPTEKDIPCKNSIIKSNITNKLNIFDPYGIGFLNKDKNQVMQHLYILSSEEIKEGYWYMYCHFGEWIISNSKETLKNETNTLENLNKDSYYKKIIVTTDESLKPSCICSENEAIYCGSKCQKSLPRPSDDFLKAFVKAQGKGFDKVLIEINTEFYADSKPFATKASRDSYVQETGASHSCWTKNLGLKVSPDNTITIKPIQEEKTSWNRKEVVELLNKLNETLNIGSELTLEQWIEENL